MECKSGRSSMVHTGSECPLRHAQPAVPCWSQTAGNTSSGGFAIQLTGAGVTSAAIYGQSIRGVCWARRPSFARCRRH